MANDLFQSMKNLVFKRETPDESLLVPILIWLSGSEKNIEVCQNVNKKFFTGNRKIYIDELSLHNKCKHIIKYPKVNKDDETTKFFYDDICSYFGWTTNELKKNIAHLNIEELKPIMAKTFAYSNKQRRLIKLGEINYGRKDKRVRTTNTKNAKRSCSIL